MGYDYLMNAASACFFICYIPELYANYKNQTANWYNMPEKVIMLAGTTLAILYAALNADEALLINYGPTLALDIIACLMRGYYVYKNSTCHTNKAIEPPQPQQIPLEGIVVS